MSPKPEKRQTTSRDPQSAIDRVEGYAKVMGREWPELERRFKAWRSGGYKPRNGPGGGRGGGPTIHVAADAHGGEEDVPVTATEAAYFRSDEVSDLEMKFKAQLAEWVGIGNALWSIRDQMMGEDKTVAKAKTRQNTLQACGNAHTCPDEAWAARAGRCDSCYRYLRRTGRDRTGRYPQQEAEIIEDEIAS